MSSPTDSPPPQSPSPHARPDHWSASSGSGTPTGPSAASSGTLLSSSVSSIWGGLMRRFSSETGSSSAYPSQMSSSWHGSSFSQQQHHDSSNNGVDGVFTPPHGPHRTASPMRPPPLEPLELAGFRDDTPPDARLLTTAIAEEIRIMVPARLAIVDQWDLVYSLDQDGASLATLYEKCAAFEGQRVGYVLVVKDSEGGIFGAYLSDPPHPAPKYFGTGECFLWRASVMASLPPPPSADTTNMTRSTTIASPTQPRFPPPSSSSLLSPTHPPQQPPTPTSASIRFKAFPYSGVNEYYMFCESHYLSVGAGDGRYGLWVDDGLAKGVSSTSLTFGNERLSDEGDKFSILGVEMWVIGGRR